MLVCVCRWEPFHLTTEEEELFVLDEELSEEHLSDSEQEEEEPEEDEEDTPHSEEESTTDSTPLSRPHSFTPSKYGSVEKGGVLLNGLSFQFTKQAFTSGKVCEPHKQKHKLTHTHKQVSSVFYCTCVCVYVSETHPGVQPV